MTARIPSPAAPTAPSREEPQPKFGPVIENFRLTMGSRFRINQGSRTIRQIAQRSERPFAETPRTEFSDETLDADDDIRINVGAHDRRGNRRQFGEGFGMLGLHHPHVGDGA
jgi:hypothetical protein